MNQDKENTSPAIKHTDWTPQVRKMYGELIYALAMISIYVMLWGILWAIITLGISFLYVNSSAYCRDCDTGLGLCGIAFIISGVVTPIIGYGGLWLIDKFSDEKPLDSESKD